MNRFFLLVLFVMCAGGAYGQNSDSLFVVKRDSKWAIKYTVNEKETAKMLAKRFYVAEGLVEEANDEGTMKKLTEGSVIYIPVIKDNFSVVKPQPLSGKNIHEIYYRVVPKDDIAIVSNYSGITKAEMRTWNNLKGNTLKPDQVLFVGWVKMIDKDSSDPSSFSAYPAPKKKIVIDTSGNMPALGGLDTVYNAQTNSGLNVLTEKGTAVFFEKPGRNTMYYAFHNEAARGSVIKVFNPGSGKTVFVKVLGPLPDTKLYANSIIGICDGAKEALGITDNKAWCELSYAAN